MNKKKTLISTSIYYDEKFLRRMLSWICRELETTSKIIRSAEFRHTRSNAYGGHAYSAYGEINVRISKTEYKFPCKTFRHGDGFTVGPLVDRLEALIMVTAHEVAHVDNHNRKNRTRGKGRFSGSERYTDGRAKRVLEAFREQREELLEKWSKTRSKKTEEPVETPEEPESNLSPVVVKRMEKAFRMESKWKKELERAERLYKQWKTKSDYYRKKYEVE